MSKESVLAATNVFIDTSVFESENFVEGNKINKLFHLASQGHVQLLMPQITYREVIDRMKKRLGEAKKFLEQNSKELDKNLRVLRNIYRYKEKFPFPGIRKLEDIESLTHAFDELLTSGKVVVFELDVDHRVVFEKYFMDQPPFHSENKKHEFPDAFALSMIEEYCRQKDISCYALSHDKDILAYTSPYLVAEKDLGTLIDRINRHIKEKTRLNYIARTDASIKLAKDRFIGYLESLIEKELRDAVGRQDTARVDVESVDFISVNNIEMNDYSILFVDNKYAQVEFDVSFDFSLEYEGTDYSDAVYDREDDRWFGEKFVEGELEGSMTTVVEGTVMHTDADGSVGNEIDIISVNNDQGLDLNKYY